MVKRFIPDCGDVIWMDLNPVAGHEQGGHRPAVVLSPFTYNKATELALCVPCTTQVKGYPFEVELSGERDSVALCDQVKSIAWKVRGATLKGRVTEDELEVIRAKVKALIG
ncbi:endoribonuclease MazF [Salmonella enterica]|nr:endoribonuclease MazF [Salmonella enterica]